MSSYAHKSQPAAHSERAKNVNKCYKVRFKTKSCLTEKKRGREASSEASDRWRLKRQKGDKEFEGGKKAWSIHLKSRIRERRL